MEIACFCDDFAVMCLCGGKGSIRSCRGEKKEFLPMHRKYLHMILSKLWHTIIALGLYALSLLSQVFIPDAEYLFGSFIAFAYMALSTGLGFAIFFVFGTMSVFQYYTLGTFDISFVCLFILNCFYMTLIYFCAGRGKISIPRIILTILLLGVGSAAAIPLLAYVRALLLRGSAEGIDMRELLRYQLFSLKEWRSIIVSVVFAAGLKCMESRVKKSFTRWMKRRKR